MVKHGVVKGREVKKNCEGKSEVLLLQTELLSSQDVQTVEVFYEAGNYVNPPNNAEVIVAEITPEWKIAIASRDSIPTPKIDPGERIIYSSKNDEMKAFMKFCGDGSIEINDNDDNAVRYSKLENAFNTLKDDFNNFIKIFNLHTHPISGTQTLVTATMGNKSTADITPAKIKNFKVPKNDNS